MLPEGFRPPRGSKDCSCPDGTKKGCRLCRPCPGLEPRKEGCDGTIELRRAGLCRRCWNTRYARERRAKERPTSKSCKYCDTELPLKRRTCEPCKAALDKRRRLRARARAYGLTPEQADAVLLAQGNRCAICSAPLDEPTLRFDHDHGNELFRGILCHGCNVGLGIFGDDPQRFLAAAAYLEQPPAVLIFEFRPRRPSAPQTGARHRQRVASMKAG